jgi:transcriptional regulator with XRE-family HTH domain
MSSGARRDHLAEFLRARRAALHPDDLNLTSFGRRRTAGLRREEVAQLAGVSVSWYTWLEQGRPVNASVDVLDALARTLRLDPVERDHLLALAGHRLAPKLPTSADITDSVVQTLAALEPCPAYVIGPRWDILAWNRTQAVLAPTFVAAEVEDRNLVWQLFTNPEVRALVGDWETEARRILSQFRAETVPIRDDPGVKDLVVKLKAGSAEFAEWWPRHDVAGFEPRERTFNHPVVGNLRFGYQQLLVAGSPGLRIVAHVTLPGDDSATRLASLVSG